MSFDPKVLRRVLAAYERRRSEKEALFAQKRSGAFARVPRLAEIEREIRLATFEIARAALDKGDTGAVVQRVRTRVGELMREREELLIASGYPPNYLREIDDCPRCADTGYIGSKPCACLFEAYKKEQTKELSALLKMGSHTFENFSFGYYSDAVDPEIGISPRQNIELVFDICSDYARTFGPGSGNLLMHGGTGLGKTFLSTCIARVVVDKGFSVVYETAFPLFGWYDNERFGREPAETAETLHRYHTCDLLILDDLGTELTNAFAVSSLYHLVNSRLFSGKKTIISTNLSPADIAVRYSQQIYSRIDGEYTALPFFGEDIRRQKKEGRGS